MSSTVTATKLDLPTADQLMNAADVAFNNMYAQRERRAFNLVDFLTSPFKRMGARMDVTLKAPSALGVSHA
ncbi:hypothetical protein [Corynebacterium belfantii]|uniref:Uncharacterized protein n=1 Tax=Corynebacterium belfantii TaxID=2014537 RepID=A0ABS0LCS9_9CORY|nr:hypothetical protein [Corynebacterium belfantii]OLN15793.1 hypothetical protein BUE64_05735 [Corynebacterium diphtheriae subsp. lausannense]QVI98874.1 hypothetical protein KFR76_01450 [Corynebacterium diphtheriae]MBG9244683.1 hypothetical protein [Corynebacterium belfantii]MBG9259100.1 hypothetical protein [Corynebacterium belfantii]MBG9265818.1 hypothetical protein [Corynebacterium belfantii]